MNKNKTTKIFLILALISSLLIFVGCETEVVTDPEEVILDGVDVLVINLWDKYELQEDGENLIPVLLEETVLDIQKHDMILNGTSVKPEDQEIYFEDNQIYFTDGDVNTYLYDYFYNVSSKALWLKDETTDTNTIVDSLGAATSPLEIADVNLDEFSLYYVAEQGPLLSLVEPGDGYFLNTLEPEFVWNQYVAANNYNIVCALDAEFTNIAFDETVTAPEYEAEVELNNFTPYFWKVKANNSVWSETRSFSTNYVVTLLKPQNDFSASVKPRIDWKELDGANEYYLQVSDSGDFDNLLYEITTTTETEFNIPEFLDFETTYFWRVKTDTSGENWSEIWMFHTDVVIVLGYPGENGSEVPIPVSFEWGALDNATTYRVQVATDEDFADIALNEEFNAADYPDSWTEPGTLTANLDGYFWRMTSDVALPVDGNENWSNAYPFLTNDGVILNTPADGNVEGVIVKFDWEEYPDATEYTLEVSTDESFTNILINEVINEEVDDNIISEYMSEIDLDLGSEYFWRVKEAATNWSEVRSFTTITEYLDETVNLIFPINNVIADLSKQIPQFSWDRLGSSDYYRIQISEQADFSEILLESVGGSRAYTPADEDAFDYGAVYYWRVRSEKSDWCETWGFRVKTGNPTINANDIFEAAGQFAYKIDLTWTDRTFFETGFEIERSDSEDGTYVLIGTSDPDYNNFADLNLSENTTYYYRGRTISNADTSAYWTPIAASTISFALANNPEMIAVSGGTFSMGSTDGDADEAPVHDVTISNDFMMGKTEITNAQFAEIMNWALGKGLISLGNDIDYEDGYGLADNEEEEFFFIKEDGVCKVDYSHSNRMFEVATGFENHPVSDVTWYGAALYANSLSEINGLTPVYEYWSNNCNIDIISADGYRLPTEAEWEYTAQYNDDRAYPWGNEVPTHALANYYNNESTENGISAVGSYSGNNALGIQDMAGNVWEWCNDAYDAEYYASSTSTDPIGAETSISTSASSSDRAVIRGGSWEMTSTALRNANRSMCKHRLAFGRTITAIGFRLAKTN